MSETGFWAWGKADKCNLAVEVLQPSTLNSNPLFLELKAKDISTGTTHSFAWTDETIYCWGDNNSFQLGLDEE